MTTRLQPRSFLVSGALLLAAASIASAAVAPVNLARSNGGARLTLLAPAGNPGGDDTVRATQALLSEADPIGCAFGAGTTTVVLSLPRVETLHRFDFLNLTAAGRVSVAVSAVALPAESPRWRSANAAGCTFGARDEVVACDLGHVEARYLKITFETHTPGRIDTFGLFGATTGESTEVRPRLVAYGSVTGRPGGAHAVQVLRVSSGSGPLEPIVDGSLGTSHAFAPDDHRPTTVIDLGDRRTLGGVNIACRTGGPGRLDIYTFNRREDADAFQPGASRQPAASARVEGRSGLSRVSVPLRAENVRYLAIVFVPGADVTEGKDFKNTNSSRTASRGGNGGSSDGRSSGTGNRSGSGLQGRSGSGTDGGRGSAGGGNGLYGNSPDGQSTAANQSADGSAGGYGTGAGGSGSQYGSGGQYGSGAGGDQSSAGGSGGSSSANGGAGYSGSGGAGGGYSSGGAGGGYSSAGGNGGSGFSSGGTGGGGFSGGAGGGFSGGGGSGGGGAGGGGGFSLAEVAAFGPGGGGGGAGVGFGGGAGGLGGFGGGDGGDIAFNGAFPGGASNGGAFGFGNPGSGGSSGGGSPLNLVPILPPPVGNDLITP